MMRLPIGPTLVATGLVLAVAPRVWAQTASVAWDDALIPLTVVFGLLGVATAWAVDRSVRTLRHHATERFLPRARARLWRGAAISLVSVEVLCIGWIFWALWSDRSQLWDPRTWININHLLLLLVFALAHGIALFLMIRRGRWSGMYALSPRGAGGPNYE